MAARALHAADVARTAGLQVVEVPGWKTRGRAILRPRFVVAHHTATPAKVTGNLPTLRVLVDGHSRLPGPLCQYGLGRDGTVYAIASGNANHAGQGRYPDGTSGNSGSYGIEAEHPGGTTPWPPAQYQAYVRLVAALCRHHGWPASRVVSHADYALPKGRKTDPNFPMPRFRSDVDDVLAGHPAPTPPAPATDEEYAPMKRGDTGNDVRKMQKRLKAVGRYAGELDGDFGPVTEEGVRAFQEAHGLDVTGRVSLWTAVHLQAIAHGRGSH